MSTQPVTAELRQWIIDQARAGQPVEALLSAMEASGWQPDNAIAALERTFADLLPNTRLAAPTLALAPKLVVPEPQTGPSRSVLWAGDREVRVLMSMRNPRVVVFGGLMSDDECDQMVTLARARLARSETVQIETGASEVNEARTSEGMFFERGEHAVCAALEARLAALLHWPLENGEGLQVLRYRPGAEYKPHYDYFDPDQPGTPAILARGGQRVASIVCYLNTPVSGGATVFPDVQLDIAPVKGNAVFFSYDRPHPVTRSLHGGAPLIEGEKWVATKWLRERTFT